jgi:hypothetical protein
MTEMSRLRSASLDMTGLRLYCPPTYARLLDLMEKYRDRPMDLADATLVLVAEKTGYRQILTLDSDFLFYRIGDRDTFDVIQVE